jgi:hypothetical protein
MQMQMQMQNQSRFMVHVESIHKPNEWFECFVFVLEFCFQLSDQTQTVRRKKGEEANEMQKQQNE